MGDFMSYYMKEHMFTSDTYYQYIKGDNMTEEEEVQTEDKEEETIVDLEKVVSSGDLKTSPLEDYEKELCKRFPGREEAIHVAILGLLSGHPVFYLGPPGTAKSMIMETLAKSIGLKSFVKLITNYTLPEELFGPINVPKLKKGEWERITKNMLPEAEIAFLDEIFKSTTILNTLLRIINEKKYTNGDKEIDVPLRTLFTASNEIPTDPSLIALYDRLTLRAVTDTITDPQVIMQIKKASSDPSWTAPKFPEDIDKAREAVQKVEVPDELLMLATDIEINLQSKGIIISNRKEVQFTDIIKASAYIHGRQKASILDLETMKYTYWNVVEDIPLVEEEINKNIAPSLYKLKEIRSKIYKDIFSGKDSLVKSLPQQTMLWRTSKTLIERLPKPKSNEEMDLVLKQIVDILDTLDQYTPLLAVKPKPKFRW